MTAAPPIRRVRVVVLTYALADHVTRSVAAILAMDWPVDDLEVVVVDNDSGHDAAARAAASDPRVRLVRSARNTGFPANNLALRDLDGIDAVALVNDDAFVEADWLRAMTSALDGDAGLGAAASKLLFADQFTDVTVRSAALAARGGDHRSLGVQVWGLRVDGTDRWSSHQVERGLWDLERTAEGSFRWTDGEGVLRVPVGEPGTSSSTASVLVGAPRSMTVSIGICGGPDVSVELGPEPRWVDVPLGAQRYDVVNNAGVEVDRLCFGSDRGGGERDGGAWNHPEEVFAFSGGGMLARSSFLEHVGLFDERFFTYYEDVDLAWRGRGLGWRYVFVPGAVARHLHAATTGGVGSASFRFHNERNRLVVVGKDASTAMARRVLAALVRDTGRMARRDLLDRPRHRRLPSVAALRERAAAVAGAAGLAPHALRHRRDRRRWTVPAEQIEALLTD